MAGNCPDEGNNKYSNEVSSLYSYKWNTGETAPSIKANPFEQTTLLGNRKKYLWFK